MSTHQHDSQDDSSKNSRMPCQPSLPTLTLTTGGALSHNFTIFSTCERSRDMECFFVSTSPLASNSAKRKMPTSSMARLGWSWSHPIYFLCRDVQFIICGEHHTSLFHIKPSCVVATRSSRIAVLESQTKQRSVATSQFKDPHFVAECTMCIVTTLVIPILSCPKEPKLRVKSPRLSVREVSEVLCNSAEQRRRVTRGDLSYRSIITSLGEALVSSRSHLQGIAKLRNIYQPRWPLPAQDH